MIRQIVMPLILTGALLTGGCATKKYVRNTATPIQAKVDRVGEETTRNAAEIADARRETKALDERTETGISAAKERAMTAESRANEASGKATEAMGKATEAGALAATAKDASDRNTNELGALRNVVANIDDYQKAAETTVQFQFGKADLSKEAKEQLDKLAADKGNLKRFVVSVEGFTDKTGSSDFNTALSQRRANAVVKYLVAKHDIPVYRIYTVGLGDNKMVDDGKTRDARTKSRRVEVKIFSADRSMSNLTASADR